VITNETYQQRRSHLASLLQNNAIAIIPGAKESIRNGDVTYRFRQDSHFYYLTGFHEPDAVLVIQSRPHQASFLFNREKDPKSEIWTGKRLGQTDAARMLGFNEVYSIQKIANILPKLLQDANYVYCAIGKHPNWEQDILRAMTDLKNKTRSGVKAPHALLDLEPLISEMRLIKTEAEIALMRKAAQISMQAHQRAMQQCPFLTYERELETEITYTCMQGGCRSFAYDPIVASGENACILHYTENNKPLRAGDLVLIDAGGEYENYAADITRTFPINGRFNAEQRALYELVLQAQQAAIAAIKPGLPWNKLQETIVTILTEGLRDLGLLKGTLDYLLQKEAYKTFYMHSSGHWLGLDVHDCGAYRVDDAWRPLEVGMVLTVEPGLYISNDIPDIPPRWKNIGIRIEDDILVTQTGYENLTADLPKHITDLEACMRG